MNSSLSEEQRLLLRLFDKSVLKKAKYAAIGRYLPDLSGQRCLDIGADNGVISYLLRERGGEWSSADLDEEVVASIRAMVGERVYRIDGGVLPFADDSFDLVVVIDALEHLHDDAGFVRELRRVMRDEATLIVNVPHHRPGSLIRRLRLAVGLTDEKHGHVRPGYDSAGLSALLAPCFTVRARHSYSRFFVELFDVAISLYFDRGRTAQASSKGNVVTGDALRKRSRQFRLFSLIYPLVAGLALLDRLLFFTAGHSLIVQASAAPATRS